jgi:hypothetical protein
MTIVKRAMLAALVSQPPVSVGTFLWTLKIPFMLYMVITPQLGHQFILNLGDGFTFSAIVSV